ncbi:hypothetical protein C8R47DRAFT_1088780 [Mycena vitilis]|nr:hypothetical protein C8R47DRAFT_1088780 [Mycena vitilis]
MRSWGLGDLIAPDAEIVVVGLMSEYCVGAKCRAALLRGNTELLMCGAHGTYDHTKLVDGRVTPGEILARRSRRSWIRRVRSFWT